MTCVVLLASSQKTGALAHIQPDGFVLPLNAPVMRNHAEALLGEKKHLSVQRKTYALLTTMPVNVVSAHESAH